MSHTEAIVDSSVMNDMMIKLVFYNGSGDAVLYRDSLEIDEKRFLKKDRH